MSMSDPLLPTPDAESDEDRTGAADPGEHGPEPEDAEGPDQALGDPDEPTLDDVLGAKPSFRTPHAGDRLSPEDLAAES